MLHHNPKVKNDVLKRLSYIIGHLEGVDRMVQGDKYCIEIVKQIQAIQSALTKVSEIVLEDHLKTCVSTAIKEGHGGKYIREIMEAIKHKSKTK